MNESKENLMKAVVWTEYGPPDVLELQEVEKPTPKDNEVLIKIHATTVTAGDCEIRGLKFSSALRFIMRLGFGFKKPKKKYSILGYELAGKIESIGKNVKLFKIDDQVLASTSSNLGTYAEYRCLPEDGMIVIKPSNMTYEEAAAVPLGGLNALHFLRKGNIQSGQKVLISGASGTIGTFAIQLAKYYGAEVTAVGNPTSLEVMKSLGADKVIDYTQEDFTKNGEIYDVIFDVVGKSSVSDCLNSIKKKGLYILANPKFSLIFRKLWISMTSRKKLITGIAKERIEDLVFLKELIEEGKIKSAIDKTYPLEQIIEAHTYVDMGKKTGNVVITVMEQTK